jgi:hypothetical protein
MRIAAGDSELGLTSIIVRRFAIDAGLPCHATHHVSGAVRDVNPPPTD